MMDNELKDAIVWLKELHSLNPYNIAYIADMAVPTDQNADHLETILIAVVSGAILPAQVTNE